MQACSPYLESGGNPPHPVSKREGWGCVLGPVTCELLVGFRKATGNLIPQPASALERLTAVF